MFSFVGYASQSVVVGSSATVNVSLEPDNTLEEVVVTRNTAYANQNFHMNKYKIIYYARIVLLKFIF